MPNARMQEALNGQLNAELYSSYLYLSMAAYFESEQLPGFAHWMRRQAREELTHGMKFFDYVKDGGRVLLRPIEGPQTEWSSPLDVFENVLRHEQKVTSLINDLVALAEAEGDDATGEMLQWFVKEQEEEEESAEKVVDQVKGAGDARDALLAVDEELAKRA